MSDLGFSGLGAGHRANRVWGPLLAQSAHSPDPLQTLYYGGALVGLLLLLALAVYYVRHSWREGADDSGDGLRMLDDYREMLAQGQISEEEFRNIKGRIARSLAGAESPPNRPLPIALPPSSPTLPEMRSGEDGRN